MHAKMFLFLLVLLLIPLVSAFDEKTLDQKFVNDQAGILSPQEEQAITLFLDELERNSSLEFAVVTIASLEGDDASSASLRAAEELGIGKADTDNGLLLFISLEEREWRIEVGYGLEGAIPDVIAGRIGREVLVPKLASGEYAEGIIDTLNALAGYALEDPSVVSKFEREEKNTDWITWILIAVMLLIIIFSRGRAFFIFLPPMGRGGNQGGFGGSGGFGGFGGGGFGGGGAGGRF